MMFKIASRPFNFQVYSVTMDYECNGMSAHCARGDTSEWILKKRGAGFWGVHISH
jgi:hypothetical protein